MIRFILISLLATLMISVGSCSPSVSRQDSDRHQISDQISKYAQLWDRKDSEALIGLFTEDAVMEWHIAGADQQPPSVQGHTEIQNYARKAHTERLAGRQSRHHFSGLVFEELSESQALTEHIFMVTHVVQGESPKVIATGTYRIEWMKADADWLMSRRALFVDR